MNGSLGRKKPAAVFGRIVASVVMVALALIFLMPLFYVAESAFKTPDEVNRVLSLPTTLYLGNFITAWTKSNFPALLLNSVVITAVSLVCIVLVGSMAAYSLSRRKEKIFKFLYYFFLSAMMVPFMANIVPLLKLVNSLGLFDNRAVLVILYTTGALPMTTLVYTGFIKSIPRELEEAAAIDGVGYLGRFFRIVFPLIKPATTTVIILNVLPVWNDFFNPFLFLSSPNKRTLSTGIYSMIGARTADYGGMYAISLMTLIVPVVLFLVMQRYFYKGIVLGGVKG